MKKVVALMLSGVLAVSMLAGCGAKKDSAAPDAAANNNGSTAADGETIKIGVLAPLTGDVSVYGIAANNGINLAIDEINKKGGVLGKQVELITADEKGDVTEASNAYLNIAGKGIVGLIGDVTSKPCMAVAELAAEENMPMITPTGTAADITTYGENVFRACFIDPYQGEVMATYAADKMSAKNVAVLYNTSDDYSGGLADSFVKTFEAKGGKISAKLGYGADDKDFKTQLTQVVAGKPDALFIPDYYNKVALIATQAREVGYKGPLLGGDGWDGVLGVLDKSKVSVVDNSYFSNHYSVTDTDEVVVNFLKNFQAKYNETPNAFAALGYDAAYMMCNAIEKAASTDKQAIVDALKATDYTGVTGQMTFDENRNPIKTVAVIKLLNGEATLDTKLSAK